MLQPVVWNRRDIPIHVSKTLVFHSCCKVWGHTVTVFSAADVLSFCRARDLASTIHTGSIAWHLYKSDQKKNGVYWRWKQRSSPGPCHYSIVVHIFFPSSKNEHDLRKMLVVCIIPFRRSARKNSFKSPLGYWRSSGSRACPREEWPAVWCQSFKSPNPENPSAIYWCYLQLHMASLTKGPV